MKIDQAFRNRQAKAGALFRRFDRIRSLTKGSEHDWNFLFRDAGSRIFHTDVLAARGRPPDLQPDIACLWGEFYRVRKQVESDLADRAFVGPKPGEFGLKYFMKRNAAATGTQLQKVMTILDDRHE